MKSRLTAQLPQTETDLNPWLLSYVRQHQFRYTRFEIDRYLLNADANPAEIEAIWQHLTTLTANQKKPGRVERWSNSTLAKFARNIFKPIKQVLLTPGLGWFVYSLVHVALLLAIFEVWPVYGIYLWAAIPAGLLCFITLILLLDHKKNRKANRSKRSSGVLVNASISLLIICTVIYALESMAVVLDGIHTDFGAIEANGHTYRAVYHSGFWEDDPSYVKLYKCEIVDLVCPLLEKKRAGFYPGNKHLTYNASTNKIEIWSNGRMIQIFDRI